MSGLSSATSGGSTGSAISYISKDDDIFNTYVGEDILLSISLVSHIYAQGQLRWQMWSDSAPH